MRRARRSLLVLPIVFIVAIVASFCFEEPYRRMMRYFYRAFTHNKIGFFGKSALFSASDYFIIGFALFCVLFTFFIWGRSFKQCLLWGVLTVALFFVVITVTAYFDSAAIVAKCTSCKGGKTLMPNSQLKYDRVFIAGLIAALLPLAVREVAERGAKGKKYRP
jgi:hypothetical protein